MSLPAHIKNALQSRVLAYIDEFERRHVMEPSSPYAADEVLEDFAKWLGERYGHVAQLRHIEDEAERQATTAEINQAVKSYVEGVLADSRYRKGHRPFDGSTDPQQIQMALGARGLKASASLIIESALRQDLC